MTCPACKAELSTITQSGVAVEVCDKGCGGIWFDNFELEKFDEAHESAGEALLDLGPKKPVPVSPAAKRECPRCPTTTMNRHYFSVREEIEIDACPACGGVWLDTGELAAIRQEFQTDEQRKQAADRYFSKLFGKELTEQAAKDQAALARAQKFARALRFICPSYWIPGKQSWVRFRAHTNTPCGSG